VFVSGPPANYRELPAFSCDESRVVPVLDTIWTVLQTGNLILAASKSDQGWSDTFSGNPPFSRSTAIPLYAIVAALGGAGMYFGFTRTSACREAKAESRAMQPLPMGAPGPGTWPPPAAAPAPAAPPPAEPPPVAPPPAPTPPAS
jgi:hypothetical protein